MKALRCFEGKWQVTLGFGLHCGWAIEGAIGSEYKIDASYLCLSSKETRTGLSLVEQSLETITALALEPFLSAQRPKSMKCFALVTGHRVLSWVL